MADTPAKPGETVTPGDSQTQVQTPAAPTAPVAPQANASDPAEVERLRKELEQKDLRTRQLENEAEARKKADEEAEAKRLEENNQFKDLYEQEKTKREAIEAERETAEREKELQKAKTEVLADYNDEVKALAADVGLDLTDADESAVKSFKEKLDKIAQRVASTGEVGPNNPQAPNNNLPELSGDDLKLALKNEDKFHDLVTSRFPGIAAMTNQPKK